MLCFYLLACKQTPKATDNTMAQTAADSTAKRALEAAAAPKTTPDSISGAFRTLDELGNTTTFLASTATGSGGLLHVHMGNSIWPGVVVDGDDGNSGAILLKAANDSTRMVLDAYNGQGAEISMRHTNGVETVEIIASEGGVEGGQILMRNKSGFATVQLDGDASGNGSGYLRLYKGDGSVGLTLEGDASGNGKVTTQVLEITGGADLSENFDIQTPDAQPGMIVSIDRAHPGELAVSARAYDRTVAGVVSGAGGVRPGMLMGQRNSKADGKHPVALTGRVYCFVDASTGAIEPGDLITTSATPGHGMKVTAHTNTHTYTHTHIHTYIHTYIHTLYNLY